MPNITTNHIKAVLNHAKVPQRCFSILIAAALILLAGCSVSQSTQTEILKTVTIQYNPTGSKIESIEVAKAVFTAKGFIEGQLPVKVQVLDPSLTVDLSSACEVRFVPQLEILYQSLTSAYDSRGLTSYNAKNTYPCRILISDALTEPEQIALVLQHELGHIILDLPAHSKDPSSIMSNGVRLPGLYRFTQKDANHLAR